MSETKIALVTGGSRGIGRAAVDELLRRGFEVHFTFRQDEAAAAAVTDAPENVGRAFAAKVDARDAEAASAMVGRLLDEKKRIDLLVNNAGVLNDRLLAMMTLEDWRGPIDTSLNGLFGTTHRVAKQMMRQKSGRIVNLTSVSGVVGIAGQTAYAAAKAAIIGFTRSLSKELARYEVPVNAIAPGFIDTDMLSGFSEKQRAAAIAKVPMNRFGTPQEIGGLIGYLAVDAPTFLTGQVIVVDGGMT